MAEYSHDPLNGGAFDHEHQTSSLPESIDTPDALGALDALDALDTSDSPEISDAPDVDLDSLEAQGFTHAEALRLVHTSERLADSREARESQALIRRLRFQRWLLERGVLNEFSA